MSCDALLEFICLLARGTARDRAGLAFRLCDRSRRGAVSRADLDTVVDRYTDLSSLLQCAGSVAELVGCGRAERKAQAALLDSLFSRVDGRQAGLITLNQFTSAFAQVFQLHEVSR